MKQIIPLVAFGSAAMFAVNAAVNMRHAASVINKNGPTTSPAPTAASKPAPRGQPTEAGIRAAEPVHKALIRCLNDFDDILDAIRDQPSFERAKPKLLRRAREHAADASKHPKGEMYELGQLARHELFEATKRHEKSLTRAIGAVPELNKFFHDEVGAILTR